MFKTSEEVRSILVISTVHLVRIFDVLEKLREKYHKAEISVLVQEGVKDEIERSGLADRVIVRIKREKGGPFRHLPLLLQLRKEMFDLIVITYNTEDIDQYSNLRLFASAIMAKERVGITTENRFQPFSMREVVLKDLGFKLVLRPLKWTIFIVPLLTFLILLIPFCLIKSIIERIFWRLLKSLVD
jgi:hypothetical protein